eukprot:CAMPEP_0176486002 /NCGR_PEP_ID=MMETSP0200_2-20121128/5338_1 /TAXON_ID=947934 /ORGANISM="Chaetoceros sp., Strain GSL56" /LENGTH=810 /DNA_ID=CAMNT_0017882679 /DNA_START=36 /DNA_END=2468 /DNA_ORIENTATION=-
MNDEAPLLLSVTQSKSFGSPSMTPVDLDSSELQLALSRSSDSMGFDLKASFDDYGMISKDVDIAEKGKKANNSNMSVTSYGKEDAESKSIATQESGSGRAPYQYPRGYGHPPTYGRPPYPPQYQNHAYYPGPYGAQPHAHPLYQGSHGARPTFHNYYNSYPHQPSGYTHPNSFLHNHPSQNRNENAAAINAPYMKSSSSSVSSATSLGSKKRTIDEVNDNGSINGDFCNHRGNSNNSVCSSGTSNTAPNIISKLICESPGKKESTDPPIHSLERSNSMESTGSSLTFGALSMNSQANSRSKKTVETTDLKDNADSMIPSPICEDFVDKGVTPVSKNTRLSNKKSSFFLDCDSATELAATHGFTPLPNVAAFVSKSSTDGKDSISPDFSLNIKPQLSWNIAEDDQDETPVSFGSNISANFWGDDAKSPSAHMLVGMTSPASLSEGFLGGNTSPISVFFEGGGAPTRGGGREKNAHQRKQFHSGSTDEHSSGHDSEASDCHDMTPYPPTLMPLQSPYFHGPPTPHSSMNGMNESRDDVFSSMDNNSRRRDRAPSNYNSPRPMFNHADRVVNLRGQVSVDSIHSMQQLPPHIPSHHHFLTSPIGAPGPRHMIGIPPPHLHHHHHHHHVTSSPYTVSQSNSKMSVISKNRCIPLKHPIPNKFQGDMEKYKNAPIPEFPSLVNYPSHMSQKQSGSLPDGMRCCVMCGQACRCSVSKTKKGMKNEDLSNLKNPNGTYAMIPTQNKGLCTSCDVNVWIILSSNLEIKWCKGCKNFRPWAAFGDKGLATKCVRCRDRQREKYAAQKEEKDKKKPSGRK